MLKTLTTRARIATFLSLLYNFLIIRFVNIDLLWVIAVFIGGTLVIFAALRALPWQTDKKHGRPS